MILDVESPFRETTLLAVQIPKLGVTADGTAAECADSDETQSGERQLIGKRRSQHGGNGRRCARFGRTAGGRRARSSQRSCRGNQRVRSRSEWIIPNRAPHSGSDSAVPGRASGGNTRPRPLAAAPISMSLLRRINMSSACFLCQGDSAGGGGPFNTLRLHPKSFLENARLRSNGRPTVGVDVAERRPDGTPCQPREVAEVVSRDRCFTARYWNGATHVVTLTRSDRKTDHDEHPHAELTTAPRSWADDPEWDATHRTLDEQDSNPAVLAAVQVGIEALDEGFTHAQRVRRYALLGNTRATAFDVLTPTGAMKRRSIHGSHEVEIENLYKVSGAS
jgi:hypothetical protein